MSYLQKLRNCLFGFSLKQCHFVMCYMTFCHVSFCHSLKFYLVVVSVFLFPYLRAFVRLLFTKLCWYWYSCTTPIGYIRIYAGKFLIQETKTPNGIPYLLMNLPYYLGCYNFLKTPLSIFT